MRRRDVGHSRARCNALPRDDIHSLVVNGNWNHARARARERRARTRIARVLHPHSVSLLNEHARGEIERLLRAAHDEYLMRHAPHSTRARHVRGDRIAQRRITGRRRMAEHDRAASPSAHGDARPERRRKRIDRRHPERERHRADVPRPAELGVAREQFGPSRRERRRGTPGRGARRGHLAYSARTPRTASRASHADQRIGHRGAHTRPATPPRAQIPLGAQLVEREHDGIARDAELRGEHPG